MATATPASPAQTTEVKPDEAAAKAKERKGKVKRAVRAACDELHALRPQPRADQIEAVLDQIRSAEEPPADEKAARAKAKELIEKLMPKEEPKAA